MKFSQNAKVMKLFKLHFIKLRPGSLEDFLINPNHSVKIVSLTENTDWALTVSTQWALPLIPGPRNWR